MLELLKNFIQLTRNMGLRYVLFRVGREVEQRSGLLKKRFPAQPVFREFCSLEEWKSLPVRFFSLSPPAAVSEADLASLQKRIQAFQQGRLTFFSSQEYEVTDWLTNPATGYRYNAAKHWTDVPDFSPEAGDIKYVWEKSRFAFLYDLIRYDYYFQENQSELVFSEIESWIAANPVNCGPNWRCSQEISLRVLNWTFALQYYKNSAALTQERFALILHSLYRHMQHVEANIDFSRKAVRNNHALTETLTLYLVGLLYPIFPESTRWKEQGKRWFEEEVAYQVYEDGTFLQFSMNYHRVVIQLLSWGLRLAGLNGDKWSPLVYERAKNSLHFLRVCQDRTTGWLPNYGNNDGALFFPLTECHFRDFRPQLQALARILEEKSLYPPGPWDEEFGWLGVPSPNEPSTPPIPDGMYSFEKSGYYVLRDSDTLTFLRCGKYKDRPFQSDNLHLDIWVDGENILRDAGSYLYNTDERWTRYFAGTASHNTVMMGEFDQMRKGPRFIWYDWIQESEARWVVDEEGLFVFEGQFTGFRQGGRALVHRRRLSKPKGELAWTVEDWLENAPPDVPMHQIWHPSEAFLAKYTLQAIDREGHRLKPSSTEGWYSEKYGQKVPVPRLVFTTSQRYIQAEIVLTANKKN